MPSPAGKNWHKPVKILARKPSLSGLKPIPKRYTILFILENCKPHASAKQRVPDAGTWKRFGNRQNPKSPLRLQMIQNSPYKNLMEGTDAFLRLRISTVEPMELHVFVNGKIEASESELNSYFRAVKAIARGPQATSILQAATFEDGKRQIKAEFTFDTSQAQKVERNIEQIRLLQNEGKEPKYADHIRVLMRFTRSDISRTTIGKKSGERVLIDDIHPKSLAIMYVSPLAEQHIKHEIRESEENVFKKAFVFDVNVKIINDRPSVYSITHLHEII